MTDTPHLTLPVIDVLAQKHLVANDAFAILDALVMLAVLDRDLSAPPGSPADGDRYLVKATGTGLFAGHDNQIAHFTAGDWSFYPPRPGFICFVADEAVLLTWNGSAWAGISSMIDFQNIAELGLGTTADSTNPWSAKLNNALWVAKTVAEGGDGNLRSKLSKESAAKTLSLLFQDNYSGRAEIGLTGDDDFHFKVSPDGSSWIEALTIAAATGKVSFPAQGSREVLTASRTYYVRTDGSDTNDGLSNTSGGAFLTIQKAIDTIADKLDLGGYEVTVQVADGTYTAGCVIKGPWVGRGAVTLQGNTSTPANCLISVAAGIAIAVGQGLTTTNRAGQVFARLAIQGFKLTAASVCILAIEGSRVAIIGNMEYGTASVHLQANRQSQISILAPYSISGSAARHIQALNQGLYQYVPNGTVTLSGSPVFTSGFASCSRQSLIVAGGTIAFSGATGSGSKRYELLSAGSLDVGGAGTSFFPGDTAGTDDGTGTYV